MSQAIRELSATRAPSRTFLTALLPVFFVLLIAFGIGVWKSARGNRSLRVTGGLVIGLAIAFTGVLTGIEGAKLAAGEPTPWAGLYERIGLGAWLLWMAVLAVLLMRRTRTGAALA